MSAQLIRGTLVQAVDTLDRWEKARIAKKVGRKVEGLFRGLVVRSRQDFGMDEVRLPIAKHAIGK